MLGTGAASHQPPRGERRLTLEERFVVSDIQNCEAALIEESPDKEFWERRLASVKERLKQMDIAMRLVACPLTPSPHVGPVTDEELDKLYCERIVTFTSSKKVSGRLKGLLYRKLSELFGPSLDLMVKSLRINVWLQITLPCTQHDPKELPEEDVVKALVNKFALAANPETASAEDVITEIVHKIALAFPQVAPPEYIMAVRVHNIALDN